MAVKEVVETTARVGEGGFGLSPLVQPKRAMQLTSVMIHHLINCILPGLINSSIVINKNSIIIHSCEMR